MPTEKRKPNWTLCVREGEKWRAIGAAWETERGNLFVRLDEGERLEGTAMFFPYHEKPPGWYSQWKGNRSQSGGGDYVERKRQERRSSYTAPTTPPNHDDSCPDPEAPDWL